MADRVPKVEQDTTVELQALTDTGDELSKLLNTYNDNHWDKNWLLGLTVPAAEGEVGDKDHSTIRAIEKDLSSF